MMHHDQIGPWGIGVNLINKSRAYFFYHDCIKLIIFFGYISKNSYHSLAPILHTFGRVYIFPSSYGFSYKEFFHKEFNNLLDYRKDIMPHLKNIMPLCDKILTPKGPIMYFCIILYI